MANRGTELGPFVTNEFGDHYLYEVNRSAFDKVGSDALYAQILGDRLFQKDTLNIIVGTDSGLLPNYILKRGLPDGSRFLFVELADLIDPIKDSVSLIEHKSRLVITTFDNWKETAEQLSLTNYIYISNVVLQQSVGSIDGNIAGYTELHWAVSQELTQLIWATKASLGTAEFTIRQLENIADNRHSSACLKDAFMGKTAFLLGGGPSLDEALPWLKKQRDEVTILAVSRICRRLLEFGLTPHIVFSIDPQSVSFDISKELHRFWKNTLFVHAYHVSAPLIAQWRGRNLFMGPRFPWGSTLNVETLPSIGPTVTNAALATAVAMGFSRVLLAGVDLCYSQDGYSHARGSNEHKAGPELGRRSIQVETNGGWMCETRPDYTSAIGIIVAQAAEAEQRGCKIINTASGAAKMPPIVYQPLEKIRVEKTLDRPEEIIHDRLSTDSKDTRITYYRAMLDELARANGKLWKIRKLAKEGLRCTDRLANTGAKNVHLGQYGRINKIEKTLNRKYKDFVPLIKRFGIRNFLRIIRPGEENAYIEDTDRVSRLRIYYQAYVESITRIIDLIEKAKQRLYARLEEEKDFPDMDLLIEQWREDHQPGRYLVWRERNPEAEKHVRLSYGTALKELENKFMNVMKEQETDHMRLIRKNINLSGVRSKALALFQQRDFDELKRLADGLAHNTKPEAERLLCLTRGYLGELHQNMEEAIEEYNKLLSEDSDVALVEDALKRIAVICIDKRDTENAVTALQCLTQLSPSYAPQYADILKLTGDTKAAARVYSDYLEKFPDDLGTMLKLGKLYKDMHAHEAAQIAFNYVLERDPDNGAAKAMLQS